MTQTRHYTCIGCPMGCPLQLIVEGNEIREISGNTCNRGEKYARQEFTDPRRNLSTTIPISGALWARLPVKTSKPVPKDKIMEAVQEIHTLRVASPVKMGQVLIDNFMGEKGLQVVACRSMK